VTPWSYWSFPSNAFREQSPSNPAWPQRARKRDVDQEPSGFWCRASHRSPVRTLGFTDTTFLRVAPALEAPARGRQLPGPPTTPRVCGASGPPLSGASPPDGS
jgi:hypothetical protein